MADRFYSVIKGEHMPHLVTEGGSTSSEAIEVRVNDSMYANKIDVLHGLQAIMNYITMKETSPIA